MFLETTQLYVTHVAKKNYFVEKKSQPMQVAPSGGQLCGSQ